VIDESVMEEIFREEAMKDEDDNQEDKFLKIMEDIKNKRKIGSSMKASEISAENDFES
jgi:translation elongation factor EF-1alpha